MSVLLLKNLCDISSISHKVKIKKNFSQKSRQQNVPSVDVLKLQGLFSVLQSGREIITDTFFHFKKGFYVNLFKLKKGHLRLSSNINCLFLIKWIV